MTSIYSPTDWFDRRSLRRGLLRALRATTLLATTGLTIGCGSEQAGATQPVATVGGIVVEMTERLRFEPTALTVAPGDTVTFITVGSAPHNVVTDAGQAKDPSHAVVPQGVEPFASPMVQGGESWQYTFDTPGEYVYFCKPHEALGMVATITVAE